MLPLLLLACEGPPNPETKDPGPSTDTVVVAGPTLPRNALVPFARGEGDGLLADALQVPLMDSSFDCGLIHGGGVAQSWTFGEDGRSLTVNLRPDLNWEDGTPVTAQDFLLGWQVAAAGPRAAEVEGVTAKAVDLRTLLFSVPAAGERGRMLAKVAWLAALPAHRYGPANLTPASLRDHPLNTRAPLSYGPWRVARWDQELVLEPQLKAPFDWQPHLAQVIFRELPEADARILALERGEVDVVSDLRRADIDRLQAQDLPIVLRHRGLRTLDFIPWNFVSGNPALQDPNVRTALAEATDLDGLLQREFTTKAGDRLGRPSSGSLSPSLCRSHADELRRLPHDLVAAKALLATSGWIDTNGDGKVDRGGEVLRLRVIAYAGNERHLEILRALQQDWAGIGVELVIDSLERDAWPGRLSSHDWDGALLAWNAALVPDLASVWAPDGAFNLGGYQDPAITAQIQAEVAETDPARAIELRHDLQRRIYEIQPALFLFWNDEVVGLQSRIQDAEVDLLSPLDHLSRWWVPEGKVLRNADGSLRPKAETAASGH